MAKFISSVLLSFLFFQKVGRPITTSHFLFSFLRPFSRRIFIIVLFIGAFRTFSQNIYLNQHSEFGFLEAATPIFIAGAVMLVVGYFIEVAFHYSSAKARELIVKKKRIIRKNQKLAEERFAYASYAVNTKYMVYLFSICTVFSILCFVLETSAIALAICEAATYLFLRLFWFFNGCQLKVTPITLSLIEYLNIFFFFLLFAALVFFFQRTELTIPGLVVIIICARLHQIHHLAAIYSLFSKGIQYDLAQQEV